MFIYSKIHRGETCPRNEILHNIDPIEKYAALRVGDYKLVIGDSDGGVWDGWFPPVGTSAGKAFSIVPATAMANVRFLCCYALKCRTSLATSNNEAVAVAVAAWDGWFPPVGTLAGKALSKVPTTATAMARFLGVVR